MRSHMQLSELQISKDLKYLSPSITHHTAVLSSILEKHGWHLLGKGFEAAVAEHPEKSYVLKIFPSLSKYGDFVKFVQNHANNVHLPRFSRYVKQIPGTVYAYVRMEKLAAISKEKLTQDYAAYLVTLMQVDEQLNMTTLHYSLVSKLEEVLAQAGWDHTQLHVDYDHLYELVGGEPPRDWQIMVHELAAYSKRAGHTHWDLHANNFLLRGNTLVIADPFV